MYLLDSRDGSRHDVDVSAPVSIYSCGYTPRERVHLGNMRPFILADLLRSAVRGTGAEAVLVQDVSDLDPRVEVAAALANQTRASFVQQRVAEYRSDVAAIGVQEPEREPLGSANIPAVVDLIARLQTRGMTADEDDELRLTAGGDGQANAFGRLDVDGSVRSMMCFTGQQWDVRQRPLLWDRRGEPGWPSPWGTGRPDENVVCAALAHTYLGTPITVHVGSVDIYSHHEIEMVTGTLAYADEYAKTWIHSGLVHVEGQRMANSAGNVVFVRDAVAEHGSDAIRLLYLGTAYRDPLDASPSELRRARRRAAALRTSIQAAPASARSTGLEQRVRTALETDLDTVSAVRMIEVAAQRGVAQAELGTAMHMLGFRVTVQ